MHLKSIWIESRTIRQIKSVERKPLRRARRAIILTKLDASLVGESGIGKLYFEDRKYFMPRTSRMDVDVLHENWRPNDLHNNPEFFSKLTNYGRFRRLAKLD